MFDQFSPPVPKSGKRKKGPSFHLQRTNAQIRIDNDPSVIRLESKDQECVTGRLLLNDFKPGSVTLFTTRRINVKQTVSITIESPKKFFCKGQVVLVTMMDTEGNILIDGEPFRYRIGINFLPASETERQTIQDYYDELQVDHLQGLKAA